MKGLRFVLGVLGVLSAVVCTNADNLSVSFTSTGFSGGYDVVVWIENSSSAFVKTVAKWGGDQNDVTTWSSLSKSTVDATSGATQSGTKNLTANWNGNNLSKTPVANGSYFLCISGCTDGGSKPLSKTAFTFDGTSKTVTGTSSNFTNISIKITGTTVVVVSPPVITSAATLSCTPGMSKTYTATATDPASKPVTFTFSNLPTGALPAWMTSAGAVLTCMPKAADKDDTIRIIASNGTAHDTLDLKVTVSPTNVVGQVTVGKQLSLKIGSKYISIPYTNENSMSLSLFALNGSLVLKRDLAITGSIVSGISFAGQKPGIYLVSIKMNSFSNTQKISIGR